MSHFTLYTLHITFGAYVTINTENERISRFKFFIYSSKKNIKLGEKYFPNSERVTLSLFGKYLAFKNPCFP